MYYVDAPELSRIRERYSSVFVILRTDRHRPLVFVSRRIGAQAGVWRCFKWAAEFGQPPPHASKQ
jgi:hypothetical protein